MKHAQAHEKDLQSALAGALALAFAQGGDLSQALPLALGALSEEAAEGDDAALQRWMAGAFLSVAAAKAPPASDGSWPLLLYLRDVLAAAAAGGEEENAALAAAMEVRECLNDHVYAECHNGPTHHSLFTTQPRPCTTPPPRPSATPPPSSIISTRRQQPPQPPSTASTTTPPPRPHRLFPSRRRTWRSRSP